MLATHRKVINMNIIRGASPYGYALLIERIVAKKGIV
jgi:hypothetical protein